MKMDDFPIGTQRIFLVIQHRHSEEFIAQAIKILDLDTIRKAPGSFLMTEIEAGIREAAGKA
jgi:Arc/MetJ family transcription regulator